MICYWAHRPHDSIRYAQRGTAHAQRAGSTALVWLPASKACAWAVLGNGKQARDGIECAEWAWDQVFPGELDGMGGIAKFTRARQLHFGGAAGSRAILAVARIRRGEVDGAADALAPVLDLPPMQRINGIVQSVNHVHQALTHAPTSAIARELQERIESYVLTPVRTLAR
ncbi:MAG: hypothetical protein ACRDRX_06200 [Pseudonocardiaceae bacterium]